MKILGIHLIKNELRYAALSGTKSSPSLEIKERKITSDPENTTLLMDWYDSQFRQIISDTNPDKISYRLTLEAKKEQLFTSIFPLGILNLICHELGIPITCYTARQFSPARIGMQKSTDLYAACDEKIGSHPPILGPEHEKRSPLRVV